MLLLFGMASLRSAQGWLLFHIQESVQMTNSQQLSLTTLTPSPISLILLCFKLVVAFVAV